MIRHDRQLVQWWPEGMDGWRLRAECECGDQLAAGGDTVDEVREAHDEWLRTHQADDDTHSE
jgi:hypothetical protein